MKEKFIAECLDCGLKGPYSPAAPECPNCKSMWREARYDYDAICQSLPKQLPLRPADIWRYRELLPVLRPNPDLTLGAGSSPLISAKSLGTILGCPKLYIKDERQEPTNSFKDRQAVITISALKDAGINELVLASTGNVAISYSAYAARAGIKVWAFLTSLVPAAKMHEVALYGTQVVKVTGSYDQAKVIAAEFARQRGLFFELGTRTIPSVESMKTISYEIAEQLFTRTHANYTDHSRAFWQAPDWYLQSVSGGLGPVGVMKGFLEMFQMGWIDHLPKIGIIQAEGCSPMVSAWKNGSSTAEPILSPRTLIATLATGDPGRTYTFLQSKISKQFGGCFESVSDEEAYRAMHFLAKLEGISTEPAAAVAFAGLVKLVHAEIIRPDEIVAINCTGHTLPVEETILGTGWARDIVLDQPKMAKFSAPEEGLLSALDQVDVGKFPRILVADDNPDVRRLIRRILQSQGEYTLFEAGDGLETVRLLQQEKPDLMILDLMMPEIDGFSVLDQMQAKPETRMIPVIVITAKELTGEEKSRLKGRIQSLMQKGDFMSDELLDEVRTLVG